MLGYQKARLLPRSPQTTDVVPVPAPQGGVNRVTGLAEMPPNDAIFMYNLIPSEFGTKVRTGYAEWATGVGTGNVKTIVPFSGATSANDKLYAMAASGIYDITTSVASPAVKLAFATVDSNSGLGVWANFVNDTATYFALYTDESNGYYTYTSATDTWAKIAMGAGATQIAGVDPALFCFVTIFKQRVWFIEKGTGNAWYLATNAIYGTATKFNFGNKFKHGGTLVALYNWTVDGGEGIDDYLVAISSGGDVIVYKGTDPSTATDWFQHGSWFIGPPPSGRRIAGSFAGELYLLSVYGILPMSKLMSGTLVQLEEVNLSKKISPLVNTALATTRTSQGWEIRLLPTENLILVGSPKQTGLDYIQYAYSLNTPGWSLYRGLPYFTGDSWHGAFYFSDETGRVLKHTGTQDNVNLAATSFTAIDWSMMMSYQGYQNAGVFKRIQFIRPIFLAGAAPEYVVEARYDYNLNEVFGASSPSSGSGALWDAAVWDLSLWSGDYIVLDSVRGGSGMGRVLSIALNGRSNAPTILLKFDLMYDSGSAL